MLNSKTVRWLLVWPLLLGLLSTARSQTQVFSPAPAARAPGPVPARPFVPGRLKHTRHPLVVAPPKATAVYKRAFRLLRRNPELTDRYDELIVEYADRYRLDPRLLKAIIAAESEFNPNAVSPAGARGLMQLMPRTAEEMGVSRHRLHDAEANIQAGAAYIEHLFSRAYDRYRLKGVSYKDAPVWIVQRVIASYHAGPRFLGRDAWFRSTRRYVAKVLLFYQDGLTDIRRVEEPVHALPDFAALRTSTGSFN